jgi:hypothetical protein
MISTSVSKRIVALLLGLVLRTLWCQREGHVTARRIAQVIAPTSKVAFKAELRDHQAHFSRAQKVRGYVG